MGHCNPKNVFFTEVRAPALTDVVSFIFKYIVLKIESLNFLPLYFIYITYICFNLFAYYYCFKCWKRKKIWSRVLTCRIGWPETHSVDQDVLEHRDGLVSAFSDFMLKALHTEKQSKDTHYLRFISRQHFKPLFSYIMLRSFSSVHEK